MKGGVAFDPEKNGRMPQEALHAHLREMPIFGGLSDAELDKVVSLSTDVEAAAGDLIVRQGELASDLFVIRRGKVEVLFDVDDEEQEQVLAHLGVGDCFGEMALIDIQPRSASVRTLEDSVFFCLSNRGFRTLMDWNLKTYTLIILNLAREISRRLRRADALLVEFADAAQRPRSKPLK